MKKPLLATCAALLSLFAAPVLAEDFTFTIPVELNNLPPNVYRLGTYCYIYTSRSGSSIGIGRQTTEVTGGAYSGDVTIAFNADAGRDPSTATVYECGGYLMGRAPGAPVSAAPIFYFQTSSSPTFPLAAGAAFSLNTGVLPIPR